MSPIITTAIEKIKKGAEPLEVQLLSDIIYVNKKPVVQISIHESNYYLDISIAEDICGPMGQLIADSIVYDVLKDTIKNIIRDRQINKIIDF